MRYRPLVLLLAAATLASRPTSAGIVAIAPPPAAPPVASVAAPPVASVAAPPVASVAAPPIPPAPKLAPLPAELESRMARLIRAAERWRGLTLSRRVPWGRVSEAELRAEVLADFQHDLPPEQLAAAELSLKAFGLIPESMDLATYYPQLLASQIAGFYDPHSKSLAVVDREGGLLGKEVAAQFGPETTRKMEDGLLIHELTHAIEDQHFDLERFDDPDPFSDSGVAHLALVEGDATLVMFDDLVQAPMESVPQAATLLGGLLDDAGAGADGADNADGATGGPGAGGLGPLPGEKEMAQAPPWFRDMLLFSYSQGAQFCLDVRRHGGQKLLDYAFAVDPPRSSEQILHPEKWYGHRDDPVVVTLPDLAAALPGYAKVSEGQLGEEGVRILLRTAATGAGPADAAAAAAGWGGDRFAVYRRDSARLLAWVVDWDSEEAARRFQAAAAHLGSGWTVAHPAPRRITLLRTTAAPASPAANPSLPALSESTVAALQARLAAAHAEATVRPDLVLEKISGKSSPAAAPPAKPTPAPAAAPPRG